MNPKLLDLYYRVKPAIPHAWRMKLRAYVASRQRRKSAGVWPILESAGRPPEWWTGWPGGRAFAFVITHDVEGRRGLQRCRAMAELEMSAGFRSSFNFVPEGEYELPSSLRCYLLDRGFEIGVHDLHHDGTLYRNRAMFSASAGRINEYLERWQAVGFRSAFMFHNLEWLQELNILYDGSTFDTDPFEPQPDGVNTIFPFLVTRPDATVYVELPYTLPQDSTVFLVLRERTGDLWKRKLEWVARHGGMALINVHPDYVAFEHRASRGEFQGSLYKEFLEHVSTTYGSIAWFALPREVAQYVMTIAAGTSACSRTAKPDCGER
jgi:hypothetical protein